MYVHTYIYSWQMNTKLCNCVSVSVLGDRSHQFKDGTRTVETPCEEAPGNNQQSGSSSRDHGRWTCCFKMHYIT